jgi:hypothetical protein
VKYLKLFLAFLWTIWGVLFFISGNFLVKHWPHELTNCLIWALNRFNNEKGYMKVVPSRHSRLWPHFTFVDSSGAESEVEPIKLPLKLLKEKSKLRRIVLPVLFRSRVKKL